MDGCYGCCCCTTYLMRYLPTTTFNLLYRTAICQFLTLLLFVEQNASQDIQQPSHLVMDKLVVRVEVSGSSCSAGIMGLRWKSSSDSRVNWQQFDGSYWCHIWRTELVSPKLMLSGWENGNKCQSSSF